MAGVYIAFMSILVVGLAIDYAAQFRTTTSATEDHLEETP
jgi:hypothetical protein